MQYSIMSALRRGKTGEKGNRKGSIKENYLIPGDYISIDQINSLILGIIHLFQGRLL